MNSLETTYRTVQLHSLKGLHYSVNYGFNKNGYIVQTGKAQTDATQNCNKQHRINRFLIYGSKKQ